MVDGKLDVAISHDLNDTAEGDETMMLQPIADPILLVNRPDGVVRVGNTRVTLDTVVSAFREGMTAEEIVKRYTTLQLGDVYSVIGYILRHPDEVEAYLAERKKKSDEVRRENEARFDPNGIRERLMARREG